jgi:tetratricopeptide (TPR) repeat protein
MSDEEKSNFEQREQELWQEVSQSEGAERARALNALGSLKWEQDNHTESLALCESARDLYLEAGRDDYLDELTDVNFGIMNNLDMLGHRREAAEAAGEIIALFRETDHPMLGELLRDQGRYWFSVGEFEKSLASHLEAIKIVNPEQTEISRGIDFLNIAMARSALCEYGAAISDLHEAMDIFRSERAPKWIAKCHGELAEIFFALGMPDELEKWARKALDYAELTKDRQWEYWLNYYLGVAQKIKGDFDSAEKFLNKARTKVAKHGAEDWKAVIAIEKEIAGLYVIKGRVSQANEILRRVATIEESMEGKAGGGGMSCYSL